VAGCCEHGNELLGSAKGVSSFIPFLSFLRVMNYAQMLTP
jgi:hypothetical protein